MNADLEEQLKEMGADYQSVVARLRAAKTVEPKTVGLGRRSTAEWLVAASLLIALALSVLLLPSYPPHSSHPSRIPLEYRLSPAEMIASQNSDGSWQNDFLTRRNAEILAKCDGLAARIAYKKALRNLRAKGIL